MMKPTTLLTSVVLALSMPATFAAEQILVDWNQSWNFFHPMSDDPSVNDATIDDTGAGIAPEAGPDLIHTGFNTGVSAWFAKQSDFTGPGGYAAVFGKGFAIDGAQIGDPNNYSSYDGGVGAGPIGYDVLAYIGTGEILSFGTTLNRPVDSRHFAAYFRTTFTAAQDYAKPRVRMLLDDNAVIFYDGVEVARVNRGNSLIAYTDAGSSDTTASNNETGASAGNENVIQSFFLDVAGGPGVGTVTPGAQADSFVTVAVPKISAGTHTIAIIVRNSGVNSSDMGMGFQLLGDDSGISANVGVAVRNYMGTSNPDDDTFTVPVTVTKAGTAATSWTSSDAGNPTGSFDVATNFGPYPVSAPVSVTFSSTGHLPLPELVTSATLTPPFLLGMNSLGGPLTPITFASSPPWTEVAGRSFLQINSSGALVIQETTPVALTPGTPKCVTLALEYSDASTGSNAEVGDSIKVELVTDTGTVNLTAVYDADGTSTNNGSAMNGEDDANLTTIDELNPDSLPEPYTFTAHWMLAGVIPADATTVTVRVTAMNDSASEFLRFGNVQIKPCVDTDGDGALDIWEEVAGTDPNNAAKNFREVSHDVGPGETTITVTSETTRTYQMYSSSDLINWTRDAPISITPPLLFDMNPAGTGANLDLVRTNLNPSRLFWKVIVHLPTTDITSP